MVIEERNRVPACRRPRFPEDFGERLEGLKKLTGLSWRQMAGLLGVTDRGALKWRRGGRPSADNFVAILGLARSVPGGFELILYGDDGAAGTERDMTGRCEHDRR